MNRYVKYSKAFLLDAGSKAMNSFSCDAPFINRFHSGFA
jgi:hypothetical protein